MTSPRTLATALAPAALLVASAVAAQDAETTTLRIQTHQSPESPSGQLARAWAEDVDRMSGGAIELEMFYSASVVKSAETFDAAASGILDCDMTNGSYQTGKNPAFQFVADVMGGYDTPLEFQSWVYYGGGADIIDALYREFGMKFVGTWVGGQESLVSTKPLAGVADLDQFKFRSPPGMESEIFESLGAKPVVMDFTEIFTALETKIIDGADASNLANNIGLGLYDIAPHTTFPGFHSMSSDHLACNLEVWEKMPDAHKAILEVSMQKLGMQTMMRVLVDNGEAKAALPEQGVTLYAWSEEDRNTFREAATSTWDEWAKKTPEAKEIVDSHKAFIERIGVGR